MRVSPSCTFLVLILLTTATFLLPTVVFSNPFLRVSKGELKENPPAEIERFAIYPWQVKEDKRFRVAWKEATRSANLPNWVRRIEMAGTKGRPIQTNDGWVILYLGNQIHAGGRSELVFVYSPTANLICGELQRLDQTTRFGNRNACSESFSNEIRHNEEK